MLGLLTVFFEDFKGVRECFAFPNFGQYKPEREGFVFNEKENRYECIKKGGNNAYLPFKRILTDSKGYQKKSYRSSEKDCGKCPLRAACCGMEFLLILRQFFSGHFFNFSS